MQLELSLDRLEVRDGPLDATWSKYKAMLVPGLVWTDLAELDASLNDNTQPTACPCLAAHSTLDDLLRIAPCGSCQQRRRFTYVALQKALTRVDHCLQLAQPTKLPLVLAAVKEELADAIDLYEFAREVAANPRDPAVPQMRIATQCIWKDEAVYSTWKTNGGLTQIEESEDSLDYSEACRFTARVLRKMLAYLDIVLKQAK